MKTLTLLLIPWILIGCDDAAVVSKRTNAAYSAELITTIHDGHKWVVAMTGHKDGGVSVVHHPDCECLKTPTR